MGLQLPSRSNSLRLRPFTPIGILPKVALYHRVALLERWFNPLFLIFKNGLISCNNCLKSQMTQPVFKTKFLSNSRIQNLVKRKLLEVICTEYIIRNIVAGISIYRHCFIKQKPVIWCSRYLYFINTQISCIGSIGRRKSSGRMATLLVV